jgi:hypothetical protein
MTDRSFFKETVKVVIGKGAKLVEIDVPKYRLCEVSEFFAAACSHRWASGREGVINLDEEDPKVFSLFLAWAFDGSIDASEDCIIVDGIDAKNRERSALKRHRQLIDCFLLGQKLLAHDFKNAAMDLIVKSYELCHQEFNTIPALSPGVAYIYANTSPCSPLRRSLVDTVLAKSAADFFTIGVSRDGHEPSKYYEEYLIEVLAVARPFVVSRKFVIIPKACYEKDPCVYHEHPGKPSDYICTDI